jgi:hypothetical protein
MVGCRGGDRLHRTEQLVDFDPVVSGIAEFTRRRQRCPVRPKGCDRAPTRRRLAGWVRTTRRYVVRIKAAVSTPHAAGLLLASASALVGGGVGVHSAFGQ